MVVKRSWTALAIGLALLPGPVVGQDMNILLTADSVESLLRDAPFDVVDKRGSRFERDRTSRLALAFGDGTMLAAKWAPAPRGGHAFNNAPRFELAAYELQKLFLTEPEYVVPPTVIRAFDLDWFRELNGDGLPTFDDTRSVLVALQYWLFNVTGDDYWDQDRFEADSVYARHFANFNLMTYLIRHSDQNEGNYLISTAASNPRVFSVDNGVAFSSQESDRGFRWRRLRIDRLPAATVARLQALTPEALERQLGTLVEFRVRADGRLEPVSPGPSLDTGRGVRQEGDRIQLGLTRREIGEIWGRIRRVLDDVEDGDLAVFE